MAAIEAGADRVLAKPINVKLLKSSVNEVLGGEFFELERSELELKLEADEKTSENEFRDKFEEYKNLLDEAIKNRDSDPIKSIAGMLKNYCATKSNKTNFEILKEIESRNYLKPSDWMFAEMKIKELQQNFRVKVKYF